VAAAAGGDSGTGARLLDGALPRLHATGGSHAQRALFVAMRDRAAEEARAGGRQRG
jgi:hypothetical protein